jgi:nitrite reductase/ring-hydroxylating ferredoxin subunit
MDSDWVAVAKTTDIPNGEMRELLLGDGVIVVAHTDSGFYAFDNNCVHMGVSLAKGQLCRDVVVCPLHRWAYDLRASVMTYPRAGRPFTTFPIRVEDGRLLVRRWPKTLSE